MPYLLRAIRRRHRCNCNGQLTMRLTRALAGRLVECHVCRRMVYARVATAATAATLSFTHTCTGERARAVVG